HKRDPNSFQACTLAKIYVDVIRGITEVVSAKTEAFLLFVAAAGVATVYPLLLVGVVWWFGPFGGRAGGGPIELGGIGARDGVAGNFVGMMVSHMSFGFGGSPTPVNRTVWFYVIPCLQALVAVASIAVGVSATCAEWARRLVGVV